MGIIPRLRWGGPTDRLTARHDGHHEEPRRPACPPAATVLLVGDWGPPYLTFARRCAARGLPAYFLDAGSRPQPWPRYSSCLAGGARLDPALVGTEEGIDRVLRAAEEVGADALVARSDAPLRWLARHRHRFEPRCKLLAPPLATLEALESKKGQLGVAARAGFDVLPTWLLAAPEHADAVPPAHYPLALRPDVPFAKCPDFKVRLARSPAELRGFLAGLPAIEHAVVAQPFRPLPNLLVHGVRSESGEMLALRAYLVYRKFEGVALALRGVELPPRVGECCRAFAAAAGLVGCFHFDLLYAPEERRAYYLEVNARLGGTTDKVARLGFDEPLLTLAAFGLPVGVDDALPPEHFRTVVNKRALLKHVGWALAGRLTELDYPAVNRFAHAGRSLCQLAAARDSVFDRRDMRGSLWFYLRL